MSTLYEAERVIQGPQATHLAEEAPPAALDAEALDESVSGVYLPDSPRAASPNPGRDGDPRSAEEANGHGRRLATTRPSSRRRRPPQAYAWSRSS